MSNRARAGDDYGDMDAIIIVEQSCISVQTPYDASFVDQLKQRVPSSSRRWNPTVLQWQVGLAWRQIVEDLVRAHFASVTVLEPPPASAHARPPNDWWNPYQAPPTPEPIPPMAPPVPSPYDEMFSILADSTLSKIYKVIMLETHPDRGGDLELSKQVNAAWDRLCAHRKGQGR